jgi:stearoyl-CoA desaturase (delta-9 desaturase)
MWTVSGLAGTVGFHRLLAHRAFQVRPSVKVLLAVFGSMAGQGPPIYWVALHRQHHSFSDRPGDPHSPHLFGDGFRDQFRGLWHAHIGWMFDHELPDSARYAPDLLRDRALSKVNSLYHLWLVIGLAIPTVIDGAVTGTLRGAFLGFLWGGLARLFLGEHLIWSINSLCHFYGTRPFKVSDHSANNVWLSFITFGEALHNNHHAFPSSAAFGLRWWQLDPGKWLIRLLEKLHLAWDVKLPSGHVMHANR